MSSLVKQARKRPSKKERKRTQTKKTSQLFPQSISYETIENIFDHSTEMGSFHAAFPL